MILLQINGVDYNVIETWEELTIERAAKIATIDLPRSLRKSYDAQLLYHGTEEERMDKLAEVVAGITDEEEHKTFPKYYGAVLQHLSDIPEDVIKRTDIFSVKAFYKRYMEKFIIGFFYHPMDYAFNPIDRFTFNGVEFLLPRSGRVFGVEVPMIDTTALEFCESADLMTAVAQVERKEFARIANMISILCRPEGEQYDERASLERAEKFLSLPMSVAWDVFFSLTLPWIIYKQFDQISLLQKEVEGVIG